LEDTLIRQSGLYVKGLDGGCLVPPSLVRTKQDKPFQVFTPFKRQWLDIIDTQYQNLVAPLGTPIGNGANFVVDEKTLGTLPEFLVSELPASLKKHLNKDWHAKEEDVAAALDTYLEERVHSYDKKRDIPSNVHGTSRLSAYLAVGSLSVRTIAHKLMAGRASSKLSSGAQVYLSELCWRDFYRHIMFHFPQVSRGCAFQKATEKVKWREGGQADADFIAWCQGQTGFPIVDAAMRQLNESGWMHNRCRMIVASFLTKDLLVIYSICLYRLLRSLFR
jgi:deoxyribodipyrimidine photo-lyase